MSRLTKFVAHQVRHGRARRGATLSELLVVAYCLLGGVVVGVFVGREYGLLKGVLAVPLGVLVAAAIPALFLPALAAWNWWRPMLPPCESGKCTVTDYTWVSTSSVGVVYRCDCGALYLHRGNRFQSVRGDDARPYKVHSVAGRWRDDGFNSVGALGG